MSDTTSSPAGAWGVGLATLDGDGNVLDTWYPAPALASATEIAGLAASVGSGAAVPGTTRPGPGEAGRLVVGSLDLDALCGTDPARGVETVTVVTFVEGVGDPPIDAHDIYLRLHLLSHRLVAPNGLNLDGVFGLLNNVVWTTAGPCPVEGFEATRGRLRAAGRNVQVLGVDKFPRMVDYVVPAGVRIADADRVRLGAHLASGTVVMHEGYVNFNAGTLGTAMVEGRISQGVVVGEGSDVGGGASIMGTLSGGGKEVIRVGERSLVGANAGIGISLGDDCTVEAGLYVTAGTRVTLPDGTVVKALELSGRDGLLFRRNSATGVVEVLPRAGQTVSLNTALHSND
ncbi:MAG TPA: 2,3,4,5-tetrahydropyridine-2,6-dicarboxylate N-succinyltransferase [Acidimicrobiales bacterium]|nr:2,3,4,5-tetrahydropyridine-2,6-dicarboxylate N-succinyltransferase [Acidimicrobiales bacterium]